MSQPPKPQEAKKKLQKAIQNNELAEELLYQVLKDASVTVGPVTFHIWSSFNDNLKEYGDVWLTLTSPEGRKWVKENLDALFDYIAFLVTHQEEP